MEVDEGQLVAVRAGWMKCLTEMHPELTYERTSDVVTEGRFAAYAGAQNQAEKARDDLAKARAPLDAQMKQETQALLEEAKRASMALPSFKAYNAAQNADAAATALAQYQIDVAPIKARYDEQIAPFLKAIKARLAPEMAKAAAAESAINAAETTIAVELGIQAPANGVLPNWGQVVFETDLKQSTLPVVVDFWAPWCSPCLQLAPVLHKVEKNFAGKVVVRKVNIDEEPKVADAYGIQSIPTLMLYRDGKVRGFSANTRSRNGLTRLFDALASGELAESQQIVDRGGEFRPAGRGVA